MCVKLRLILKNIDSELVKELLFAIFEHMPKVKRLTIECPALCPDLTALFEDLGFSCSEYGWSADMLSLFVEYDLIVHPKCKLCEVLYAYGADFWEQEIDPSQDGQWGSWAVNADEPDSAIMYTMEEGNDDEGISAI